MQLRIFDPVIKLKTLFSRIWQDRGGVAIIETALVLPLLLFIGLGGMEVAYYVWTHSRVSQIGLSAADNASRIAVGSALGLPQVRENDIVEVFTGAEHQANGMNFEQRGRIILSSLEMNADGGQWIHWQRCFGDLSYASSYGDAGEGQTGTSFVGMGPAGNELQAPDGASVMFVEIAYEYRPLVLPNLLGTHVIRSTAAYTTREVRDLSRVYPFAGVTPDDCTS